MRAFARARTRAEELLMETCGLLAKSCLLRKRKATGSPVYGHRGVLRTGVCMLTPNKLRGISLGQALQQTDPSLAAAPSAPGD